MLVAKKNFFELLILIKIELIILIEIERKFKSKQTKDRKEFEKHK